MSELRYCPVGGKLVGGGGRLPSDPCEYNESAGCNRLRCSSCGEWVRIGPPGVRSKGGAPPDLAALFSATDWLELPFIVKDHRDWRLYACKCNWWEETSMASLENDHDSPSDPNLPWACAGH